MGGAVGGVAGRAVGGAVFESAAIVSDRISVEVAFPPLFVLFP